MRHKKCQAKTLSLAYKGGKRDGMEKGGQDMKMYLDSLKESSLCVNRIPGLALLGMGRVKTRPEAI